MNQEADTAQAHPQEHHTPPVHVLLDPRSVKEPLRILSQNVEAVQVSVVNLTHRISDLETTVEGLQAMVNDLKTTVSELNSTVTRLTTKTRKLVETVGALNDDVKNRIKGLVTHIGNLRAEVVSSFTSMKSWSWIIAVLDIISILLGVASTILWALALKK